MNTPWLDAGILSVGGKALEYQCVGPPPGEAPTLVLLHEGLGCVELWRDFPAKLSAATGYGVFTYSRAGYGQSDPADLPRPLDYMTHEAVDVLPVVLDAIGVQRVVLLGHSDGATIAAIHAGRVVDSRLTGVALIAPHFFTEAAGLKEIAKAREAFNTKDLRERLAKYHRDPDNAFRGWNDSWLDPEFESWNVTDTLDNIRTPVLAIQGREDPYGTLAQINVIEDRVCLAPVTKLIVDDCRHAPHQEHGLVVVSALAEFCGGLVRERLAKPTVVSMNGVRGLPDYAYIPGQNKRHPEEAFDTIRQTAMQGDGADQLSESEAFRAGLRFLHEGFYWEAHEVLEPVWMALPDSSLERWFVQGLIQLANGCLKLRMGRAKAALRLVGKARALMPDDASLTIMTIKVQDVHCWIKELEEKALLAI